MSVLSSDIKYYLTPNGNGLPDSSLGGVGYGTEVLETIHELFDIVSSSEALSGDINYRAIGVMNTNATDTLFDAVLYISLETTSGDDTIAVAYDEGTQSVATEVAAPSAPALDFSTPLTKADGIALGDIAPGALKRIWLKRTVSVSAEARLSEGELTVAGGTT